MLRYIILLTFVVATMQPVSAQDVQVPEELTLKEIFLEPVLPGIRPSLNFFSGDQSAFYFTWNDSSYYETGIYKMNMDGTGLEDVDDEETPFLVHSPDNQKVAYTKDGNLYTANADGSDKQKLVASRSAEYSPRWSPNSQKIAFVREGDVWVSNVHKPGLIQVTNRNSDTPSFSINAWAGNDKLVLSQADFSDARTIYFPEYLDDFVVPGETTRGIPSVNVFAAPLDTTAMDTLLTGVHRSSVDASNDGQYVAIDYADAALKHRKIIVHNLHENSYNIAFEDSTDGWLHHTYMSFAPTSNTILFLSEQSGWNHLYTVNADGSNLQQHTSGEFYLPWARWKNDNEIIYASNEVDYGSRNIHRYHLDEDHHTHLTDDDQYRYQFRLSPNRQHIVYAKTYFNEPYDLFRVDLDNPGNEIQLTQSVPDRFYDVNWQLEEYVRFTGRDGETDVSMSLLYPEGYSPDKTYPVVVFAHGAGSLQNVYKGWSNNYWREYMFHQYLNKHGYIVVDVDFRHSTGYGRAFREDVTNWMGKYETIDIADGLDYAQELTGGALDLDNVGIYGGSYGGFMALYALTDMPDRFHAGAALRKVTNWRNYYHANPWYTLPRLGDPDEVPEHYDRSSPLTYASELERPAILLHGLIDDNVGAQDAFQYIEELIQSGNEEFELMIYPSERHGFTSPMSWYDEYRRIFEFFEKHLK